MKVDGFDFNTDLIFVEKNFTTIINKITVEILKFTNILTNFDNC